VVYSKISHQVKKNYKFSLQTASFLCTGARGSVPPIPGIPDIEIAWTLVVNFPEEFPDSGVMTSPHRERMGRIWAKACNICSPVKVLDELKILRDYLDMARFLG
jgi:hypothetical protein